MVKSFLHEDVSLMGVQLLRQVLYKLFKKQTCRARGEIVVTFTEQIGHVSLREIHVANQIHCYIIGIGLNLRSLKYKPTVAAKPSTF